VCLFVDGKPDIFFDAARRIPEVTILSNDALRDPWLHEHCRGWGHTKMAMLWESPFENFLYLDADTIVWGDVLSCVNGKEYDVVVDQQRSYDDAEISKWFFNPENLLRYFPDFNYDAYRARYACNGTFFIKRGVLDLELYKQAYALQRTDPNVFFFADMGIWNFIVFYGAQKNQLNIVSQRYQVIPLDHSQKELREKYSPSALKGGGDVTPAVLHFCGKKAHIFSPSARVAAMNHFRLRYLTEVEGLSRFEACKTMMREDSMYVFKPKIKKLRAKLLR
jgi:hypothetical protein